MGLYYKRLSTYSIIWESKNGIYMPKHVAHLVETGYNIYTVWISSLHTRIYFEDCVCPSRTDDNYIRPNLTYHDFIPF
jgi:hypothetical protein